MEFHPYKFTNKNIEKRIEVKFITNISDLPLLKKWIKLNGYGFKRNYKDRFINNIYFDSQNFDSFNENIIGLDNRFKLRIRWYGKLGLLNDGYFESKIKKNSVGYKIKEKLKKNINLKSLTNQNLKDSLSQLKNPYLKNLYQYRSIPILINRYKRSYFLSNCKKFRITVDTLNSIYKISKNNLSPLKYKFLPEMTILEFKTDYNNELSSKVLTDFPIRHYRNSKYINSFKFINQVL